MKIQIEHLTKTYTLDRSWFKKNRKTKEALKGIDLTINHGESIGLIGLNGAGKSTLIKILCGVLTPSSGQVMMDELKLVPGNHAFKSRIGVLFGHRSQLWGDLSILDSYKILRKIYNVPREIFEERLQRYSDRFQIKPLLSIPLRKLSLGQRMKCEIVGSLLHNPDLLLLDEATLGLDIFTRDLILNEIEAIRAETKMTMVFTSHNMNDIERTCKRIVVLDQGRVIFDGQLNDLVQQYANLYTLRVHHSGVVDVKALENVMKLTPKMSHKQLEWILSEKQAFQVGTILDGLKQIVDIDRFSLEPVPFESVIKNIYENRTAYESH